MLTHERKAYLLSLLTKTGSIIAKDVSQTLGLSEDTIRRDLRELAKEGRLKRVHGGAAPLVPADAPFAGRAEIAPQEKVMIGRSAAQMIEPGQVVFIDGGTTAIEMARHIPQALRATIITHSPHVALELLNHPQIEVELIGGRLLRHSMVAGGAATIAWLDRYRPDACFIGATGLHPDQGITTGISEDAEVKRAVIARSGSAYILASSEKFRAVSAFKIADWTDIEALIVADRQNAERFSGLGCGIIGG